MAFSFNRNDYPPFYPMKTVQSGNAPRVHNSANRKRIGTFPYLWACDPSGTMCMLRVKTCREYAFAENVDGRKVPVGLDDDFTGSADQSQYMSQTLREKKMAGWILLRDVVDVPAFEAEVNRRQAASQALAANAAKPFDAESSKQNQAAEQIAEHLVKISAGKKKRGE